LKICHGKIKEGGSKMILIIILVAIIGGVLIFRKRHNIMFGSKHDTWTCVTLFMSCILLGIMLLCIPLIRMSVRNDIIKFNTTNKTLNNARQNKTSDIERAAILKDVINRNNFLITIQYWNKNLITDIFIPDEIDNLKPME